MAQMLMKMLLVAVVNRNSYEAENSLAPYDELNENYFSFVPLPAIRTSSMWDCFVADHYRYGSFDAYLKEQGFVLSDSGGIGKMENINARWDWRVPNRKCYDLCDERDKKFRLPDALVTLNGTWVDNPSHMLWLSQLRQKDAQCLTYFVCHSSKLELKKGNQYGDFDWADCIAVNR